MLSVFIHTLKVQLSPQKREERRVVREREKLQRRMKFLAEEAEYFDALAETLRKEANKNRAGIILIFSELK